MSTCRRASARRCVVIERSARPGRDDRNCLHTGAADPALLDIAQEVADAEAP